MPALFTRTSIPPNVSTVVATAFLTAPTSALSARTASALPPRGFDLPDDRFGLLRRGVVGDGDGRAVPRESPGDRRADAARAPGDQGNFSGEVHCRVRHTHHTPSCLDP